MTRNAKLSLGLVAVLAAGVLTVLLVSGSDERVSPMSASADDLRADGAQVVRPESHRLSTATRGNATLVEFLDFECEACGAVFPVLEELRAKYRDRLTFVIRYFPNRGHFNGQLAAQAVEAAARQDRLEDMYEVMFQRQQDWGEAKTSKASTFVSYARELGLDVPRFQKDMMSMAVQNRVLRDRDEGLALGVQGTPTIFLDGERLELSSVEQLEADIRAAIDAS